MHATIASKKKGNNNGSLHAHKRKAQLLPRQLFDRHQSPIDFHVKRQLNGTLIVLYEEFLVRNSARKEKTA